MLSMVFYQREVVSVRNSVPLKTLSARSAVVNVKKIANGEDVKIINEPQVTPKAVLVHSPVLPKSLPARSVVANVMKVANGDDVKIINRDNSVIISNGDDQFIRKSKKNIKIAN